VFGETDFPIPAAAIVFLIVGPGYSLPGYYAFRATEEANPFLLMAAMMMYTWGSLINVAADFYKDGCKVANPKALVTEGPYRLARHINWFGDWMR
jgi:protein-S-isoprenylcysteine O-methyltransferase Ste14